MGLADALALTHLVILQEDEAAASLQLAVGEVEGVHEQPVGIQDGGQHVAVHVLHGDDNAPAVHAVRVHRVLAVQVAGQQDEAAQAQGQADDVDQGVSFGTCQVACRVFQGFHINDNLAAFSV